MLSSVGFDTENAESILEKGFGWGSQAYWSGSLTDVVPTPEQVQCVLDFLGEQNIQGPDLLKLVSDFPEVLALHEKQLKYACTYLEYEYYVKGDALTNYIKNSPTVLGANYDCAGDCKGECNRCWVRF
mmetsp:Transcript_42300/g.70446  ORF Transcript_42300/g.70446 Transcript_42300/m.70446 type:complete len:128 (-) Transcript_42300:142-525(-)